MRIRTPGALLAVSAVLVFVAIALAQQPPAAQAPASGRGDDLGFTDTPILPGLPYHVHDPARPHPPVVSPAPQPGGAPSDAIVLFDGKDLSKWTFDRRPTGGANRQMTEEMRARMKKAMENAPPLGWKVADGYVEVVPRAGDMLTKEKFGDAQLHVEFQMPENIQGKSQNRGNSGILLQSRYEVQVLDSYQSPTYADGQLGAVYGQWPPLVNAARKPGEWQSYDIVFEAPKFEGEKLVKPAYFTVFLNGLLLHNHKESMGPMVYRQVAQYTPQPAEDSLMLQNHSQPVRYRNIWIRRLKTYDQPER
jgi:hypothetical protein